MLWEREKMENSGKGGGGVGGSERFSSVLKLASNMIGLKASPKMKFNWKKGE